MDHKEASDIIEAAINSALPANEDYRETDMLLDWVVVGFVDSPDSDTCAYPIFVRDSNMPTYKLRGLLEHALSLISCNHHED